MHFLILDFRNTFIFVETDACLVEDAAFRPAVEEYAANQDVFFSEYAAVIQKLSELGSVFNPPDGIRLP